MLDVRHAATTRASPEAASRAILSPEGIARWFGGAKVDRTDPSWPAVGSTMAWTVMRTRFDARVVENALPARLVQEVETPSGRSRITHSFASRAGGGCTYEKRVEASLEKSGWLGRKLMGPILRSSVRKEVEKAARFADESATR
jgi:uncharacterized protein YndB with AHSA1/START domain